MEQDINQLWIFFGILSVIGLGLFMGTFFQIKKMRLILSTPTSKIRSAAQGYTELKGFIDPNLTQALSSPLSQTPCYWFKAKVERLETTRNSKGGKKSEWRTIHRDRSSSIFYLNDNTGFCEIDPGRADFIGGETKTWRDHSYKGEKNGVISSIVSLSSGTKKYRFTEHLVFDQSDIYVLGNFETFKDDEGKPSNRLSKPGVRGQHFILGVGSEEDMVKTQRNSAIILGVLFLLTLAGVGYFSVELVDAYRVIRVA